MLCLATYQCFCNYELIDVLYYVKSEDVFEWFLILLRHQILINLKWILVKELIVIELDESWNLFDAQNDFFEMLQIIYICIFNYCCM